MISLLDCTLRDGGDINNWNFGKKQIDGIVEKLNKTNVEIVELGFLRDEEYCEDRVIFNSIDILLSTLNLKKQMCSMR